MSAYTFFGFTQGETVFYAGLQVRLMRTTVDQDGFTWRVQDVDPRSPRRFEAFNIASGLLHLLSREVTG